LFPEVAFILLYKNMFLMCPKFKQGVTA